MIRFALTAVLLGTGVASAQEYRNFESIDGRSMVAEVVASEASGFLLRIPTGLWRLPYTDLADMRNATEAEYLAQPDWPVWIVADATHRRGFVSAYRAMEGVVVVGEDDTRFSDDRVAEARACDMDLMCATDVFADAGPVYVVRATLIGSEAVFETAMAGSEFTNVVRANRADTGAIGNAVYDSLGLVPPEGVVVQIPDDPSPTQMTRPDPVEADPPTGTVAGTTAGTGREGDITTTPPPPPRNRSWTQQRVLAASFIPVPGYTAFAQGDSTGGAIAVATVLPLTAAWVGTTGKNAQTAGEHVALSVGGFYLATVAANQVLGLRAARLNVAAGVVPTEGGAVVTVSGRR